MGELTKGKNIRIRDIFKGIGLVIIMHFLPAVIPAVYLLIGLFQWIYIIPAVILCRKNKGMVAGILIAAAITLIANVVIIATATGELPPEEMSSAVMHPTLYE